MTPADVVRAQFQAYLDQDRETAEQLLSPSLVFTSPQDDHIDKARFFKRCFPTAGRLVRQEVMHITPANERDVFIAYEYELKAGGVYRNTELITVVDGQITEIQVFFGGRVR